MITAFVLSMSPNVTGGNGASIVIEMDVLFTNDGSQYRVGVPLSISNTDSPITLTSKIADAVKAVGSSLGISLTGASILVFSAPTAALIL